MGRGKRGSGEAGKPLRVDILRTREHQSLPPTAVCRFGSDCLIVTGAGEGIRTRDLLFTKQLLYH